MKKGFTLAEVLITLGVIGVVAAMTLPILVQNYQKMVWVNQLKKSYSVLEQGFQKMMADEEVDNLMDVSIFSSLKNDCTFGYSSEECKPFNDGLKKYFKGDYVKVGHAECFLWDKNFCDENQDDVYLHMPDGITVLFNFVPSSRFASVCEIIKSNGGHMCYSVGNVWLDINGDRGPNQYGRDIFNFSISNNGKLYGIGGKDWYLFDNFGSLSGYTIGKNCTDKNGDGSACTGYIIENGWKMDY